MPAGRPVSPFRMSGVVPSPELLTLRKELQALLNRRGYDVGEPDGAIGDKTRAAVADYQARAGLPRDGRAGGRVLKALRSGR